MVSWPLLMVNLRILGLIWWGTTYFDQNDRTIISPDDTRRTMSELPDVGAKLEPWFSLFTVWYSFGIIYCFSWIFDAVSSEKMCPTSMLFLWAYIEYRTVSFSRLLNPDWSVQIPGAATICKERWRRPEMPLTLGSSGTQYVAMLTKLLS